MTSAASAPPTTRRRAAPDAELVTALRVGVLRLSRRLRNERSVDDPPLNQLAVLRTLERVGPSTIGELAASERVKPPSMTRTVNCLEDAGLVARRAHASDGRQVVVDVTPAGRALLAEERRRRDRWLSQHLATLTADERELLRRAAPLLDRLATS